MAMRSNYPDSYGKKQLPRLKKKKKKPTLKKSKKAMVYK